MKKNLICIIMVALLSGCGDPHHKVQMAPVEMKCVSLNTIMNDGLPVQVPVTLAVPKTYVHADIPAPVTYSYWMPMNKIAQVKANQDLPTDTGWLYGNISLSVGYDQDKKAFFGDGRYTVAQVLDASGCKAIEEEHISVNGHPILLLKVQEKKSGKIFYTIYIAMMLESNNIFIAYRPPVNNPTEGAYVWDQLKKSIRESNNAAQTTGKPATGR